MSFNFRQSRQQQGQIKHRWGAHISQQQDQQNTLLGKKDMQIKRLQSELENEKKRADNALKILDSFRSSQKLQQQSSVNSKSEISKRIKAEQQARRLKLENEKLKQLLIQQIKALEAFQSQAKMAYANI